MAFSEEDLIASVLRVKSASSEQLTAKQVHEALTAEGITADFAAVKKAASKAAKRAPAETALPAAPVPAPTPPAPSKQDQKRATAQAEALKAGELAMFTALKELHQERWMVALHGESRDTKAFIDRAAAFAIAGALTDEDGLSKERVEADVATLQYILLPGSPFELPEEECSQAREQLEKLERFYKMSVGRLNKPFVAIDHFQGARPGFVFKTGDLGMGYYHEAWFAAAVACYKYQPSAAATAQPMDEVPATAPAKPVDPQLREILEGIQRDDASSLDRAMAKATALAAKAAGGSSAMDDMD